MRPGVFSSAVDKLNLLQPEFVLSVGDFIAGYTRDPERINAEWEVFESRIARLEMPFHPVPGNHDITNETMAEIWEERWGPRYRSFVHGDVLFLCLDSNDTLGRDRGWGPSSSGGPAAPCASTRTFAGPCCFCIIRCG